MTRSCAEARHAHACRHAGFGGGGGFPGHGGYGGGMYGGSGLHDEYETDSEDDAFFQQRGGGRRWVHLPVLPAMPLHKQ